MKGKIKSQYIGLLLIFIMFFSTFAFAIINSVFNPSDTQSTPTPTSQFNIEKYMKRALTHQENAYLTGKGIAVLEFLYTKDCTDCPASRQTLLDFSKKYSDLVVVDVEGDKNQIQFSGKKTVQVSNTTEKTLLDAYCSVTFSQPKDCVLKNF